ncbi:DUF3604 domain-containing protein [Parasphingorhabdus halotolerans]|uniref:DUF3604 domain-containing protein n=1 Tax=Parasphingorhabdus halotolerans TaxID=2725558 RepID=A0A6H2DM68_9SPHN|nr:DUF3604 domain-containing protein [Parasphingorhabdus halotolerans]QJB69772.1 DUF3604 domain-containing protein [Parasphingorhabdus halotolerans]
MRKILLLAACTTALAVAGCKYVGDDPDRMSEKVENTEYPEQVFWGDTHLHTDNSVDAFGFGNRLNAEQALRFARGEEVTATKGAKAKLSRPLDFLVIADHSDAMGATKAIKDAPRIALLGNEFLLRWHDMLNESDEGALRVTAELIDGAAKGTLPPELTDPKQQAKRTKDLWEAHGETVDKYNEPGKFTAFMGFEYTPMPGGDNLHRVVMFRDGAKKANQVLPYSSQSFAGNPEKLWEYMAAYEKKTGGKILAMPHNSNVSNGRMFEMQKYDGSPIDKAYAETRAKYEPVVEATQIKGDSEAHPFLSPNDEFAAFGDTGWDQCNLSCTGGKTKPEQYAGSYTREALKRGLELMHTIGANPFKFGMIGSTDSHTSLATADENNFFGKHSQNELNNKDRAMQPQNLGTREGRFGWHYLSSGYAAAWATSNSREAIFDAFMRREVYATTGPRMTVRFFGGFDFSESDTGDLVKTGYAKGVPMGGDLTGGEGKTPTFLISAMMDPESASLDRIQVVKGWVDAGGKSQEKIYNVSWSMEDTRTLGADGKLAPAGNTVDLSTGKWDNGIGAPELVSFWQDPDFDAGQNAFYYVRVLEIPTPTWPVYDALKFGLTLPDEVIKIQQERAYSSPIWYSPKA